MAHLAGSGLRILLIGTASHGSAELPDLPSVATTVDDLGDVFVRHCGAQSGQVHKLLDPTGIADFGDAVVDAASAAEDVLLVYYLGHGLLDGGGRLYLATSGTKHPRNGLEHRAFPYAELHRLLGDCPARTIVVVLDCCFSGVADGISTPNGLRMPDTAPRPDGGFLLASAAPEEHALAPSGERHTVFSGTLIRLLRDGHPAGPPDWTLDELFAHLERELARRDGPAPHRAATGHAGELELAPNPRHQANPYRGLAAYEEADARFFFGRASLTRRLRARLADQLTGAGMLVVVGPSGSGKSSLLRAGLIPALRDHGLPGAPGSARWPVLVLTPGAQPLRTLATKLAGWTGEDAEATHQRLSRAPAELHEVIRAALIRDRGADRADRMILIVDQFEEVLTACEDDAQRRAYLLALRSAAKLNALVVLGLRSDFYPDCAAEPWGEPLENQLIVPAMSESQLRQVIERPAEQVGLRLEPGLTDRLLYHLGASENGGRPAAHGLLPLLSYTLSELWERRGEGRRLTLAQYGQLGGIFQAISRGADECYGSLREEDRRTARSILPRLVHLGERGAEDTRHRVWRGVLPAGESTERVLTAFTDERLLIRDHDPVAGEETVELAHLALAHKWDKLRDWIERDRKDNQIHQWLNEAAAHWDEAKRPADELPRGERLAEVKALAAKREDEIGNTAEEYLAEAEREEEREAERRKMAIMARRKAAALRRRVIAAIGVLAALMLAVLVVANASIQRERDNAVFERVTAQSDRLAGSDAAMSAQLALSAYRMRPDADLGASLITKTNGSPLSDQLTTRLDPFDTIAFGPDGQTMAIATSDHHIQLWRIRDQRRIEALGRSGTGHTNYVNSLAFRPDGRLVASTSTDENIRLWDVADPVRPRALGQMRNVVDPAQPVQLNQPLQPGRIGVLAFSPDGRVLAAASRTDHTVWLWNVADPANPAPVGTPLAGHQSYINALAFSPDGRTLATASADKTVGLWNVTDPAHPGPAGRFLTGHRSFVNALAFSPDGQTLASTSADQTVRLWHLTDPAFAAQELATDGGDVTAIVFSADGRMLASANSDRTIRLWILVDPARAVPLGRPLTGHSGPIRAIFIPPDGRSLVGVGADGTVRRWHLPATVLTGHTGAVYQLAFSPDGRTLASGGADRAVRLWDLANPAEPRALGPPGPGPSNEIGALAFEPDGHTVATNGANLVNWAWRISDPASANRPEPAGRLGGLAFSPDTRTLALAGTDQSLSLWRVTGPNRQEPLSQPLTGMRVSYVNAVGFSHNGRILAHASADRRVRLWNVADPARPVELGTPFVDENMSYINAVAFSPDDRILAAASSDQTIRLWDISDPTRPRLLRNSLTGHTNAIHAITFSPDGRTLATGSTDHTVLRWDISDPNAPRLIGQPLTGHTGAVHAIAFSPDGRVLASAGDDQTVRIWRLDLDQTIQNICDNTHNVLTEAAWRKYVSSDLPYRPPCP